MPAAKIHGGTPTPTCRTRDAKEASVLFRPELSALYGKKEPTAVSWAIRREVVAAGEAEPIDGRVGILGMVRVEARFAVLAGIVRSGCVAVQGKIAFEEVLEERSAISGRGSNARILNLVPWRAICGGM